jgi:hypothetical protein
MLFQTIAYSDVTTLRAPFRIPKSPGSSYHKILEKCLESSHGRKLKDYLCEGSGKNKLFYFRAVFYWFKVLIAKPVFREDGKNQETSEMKELVFKEEIDRDLIGAFISSNLFSLFYTVWSSCQVVNSPDFDLPFNLIELKNNYGRELSKLFLELMSDLKENSILQKREYSSRGRNFTMEKQYFFLRKSKPIIDEIDKVLAKYYGFTEEELDFIINYDIKYRMGKELEGEE